MMPRIDAGERLAAINDRALAFGSLSKFDAERIGQRLEAAAAGVPAQRPAKANPAALGDMGIGVRTAGPAASGEPSAASEKGLSDG